MNVWNSVVKRQKSKYLLYQLSVCVCVDFFLSIEIANKHDNSRAANEAHKWRIKKWSQLVATQEEKSVEIGAHARPYTYSYLLNLNAYNEPFIWPLFYSVCSFFRIVFVVRWRHFYGYYTPKITIFSVRATKWRLFLYINLNIVAFLSIHTAIYCWMLQRLFECMSNDIFITSEMECRARMRRRSGGSLVNYIHFFCWALNGWTKFRWVDPVYMNIACKRLINAKLPIILCNAFIVVSNSCGKNISKIKSSTFIVTLITLKRKATQTAAPAHKSQSQTDFRAKESDRNILIGST